MADKIFRPNRGTKSDLEASGMIPYDGEIVYEIPETGQGTGKCKIKMGDGTTTYSDLPYAIDPGDTNIDVGYIDGTNTIYISRDDSNIFWYVSSLSTVYFNEDSGIEYTSGSDTLTYTESDYITYNSSDNDITFTGTDVISTGEKYYVDNFVDLDAGEAYFVYDTEAHEEINELSVSINNLDLRIDSEVESLEEKITEVSDNAIETIKVNGEELEVVDKTVDIIVPTKTSELENDSDFAIKSDVDAEIKEVDGRIDDIISEGGEPNVITKVKVNGVTLEIVDKAVDVIVPTKVSELENDADYATISDIPTKVSDLENDSGYITEEDIDIPEIGYIDGTNTIYISRDDSNVFWYVSELNTVFFSDDSGLEYTTGSDTISFEESDDFTYDGSSIIIFRGQDTSTAINDEVYNFVDLDSGSTYTICDTQARNDITVINSQVADMSESITNLDVRLTEETSDMDFGFAAEYGGDDDEYEESEGYEDDLAG